ncbi:MAG: GNAT family N-acetyltransferase [Oscillospiraceae bacterium]|nr:GNAT family N-acetyltransferase [Oscillospiraceae bacterium]
MSIRQAQKSDFAIVKKITHTTIQTIYPNYYPPGAVAFFLHHHNDKSIAEDITNGIVFLCCDKDNRITGTVTIRKNEIARLFVLPDYQGKGYGKELLAFAEAEIAKQYHEIIIDASLSAKALYLKRGYQETEYHMIQTENNNYLCYDVMKKALNGG